MIRYSYRLQVRPRAVVVLDAAYLQLREADQQHLRRAEDIHGRGHRRAEVEAEADRPAKLGACTYTLRVKSYTLRVTKLEVRSYTGPPNSGPRAREIR